MNDLKQYDDAVLLNMLKDESAISDQAFEVIWYRYSNKLRHYCLLCSKNTYEAEELFQDSWMKFYDYAKKENDIESIKFYLFKIAYNLHLKNKIDEDKDVSNLDLNRLDEFSDENNFLEEYEYKEYLSQFNIALNYLDNEQRESLILHWVEGFSFEEVAWLCDESIWCIRKRCERAMEKILTILEPDFINIIRRKRNE